MTNDTKKNGEAMYLFNFGEVRDQARPCLAQPQQLKLRNNSISGLEWKQEQYLRSTKLRTPTPRPRTSHDAHHISVDQRRGICLELRPCVLVLACSAPGRGVQGSEFRALRFRVRYSSRFKNNCFAVMRSGSEEGSYFRLVDFYVTQTLGRE